jgi:hypothetical protein
MERLSWTWLASFIAVALLSATPAAADPNCKCRLYTQKVEIGTVTCIKGKLARCEMFQNTPSWKYLAGTCPMARITPWNHDILVKVVSR